MTHRIGIEIGARRIRAVALGRRAHREVVEVDWDRTALGPALDGLRRRLGSAGAVALTIDPEWLFVKRVALPPVGPDERRRILAFEPERFFPVRGEPLVIATRTDDDLVFAAREGQIEEWIAAAERLGRVERVEPAPVALARACAAGGLADATVLTPGSSGHTACVRIVNSRVESVRRVRGTAADAAALAGADEPASQFHLVPWSEDAAATIRERLPDAEVIPLPATGGVDADFACAYGAALGIGAPDGDGLVPPALARRLARRQRDRSVAAVATVVIAALLAVVSLDASRNRAAARVDAELARLRTETADLVALQSESLQLEAEVRALDAIAAGRADPLAVLLEISRRLPVDVYLRSFGGGARDEWEVDGYARNAAGMVPTLEASAALADVRFRAATMRVRVGNQDYESFSLTLRHVPAP